MWIVMGMWVDMDLWTCGLSWTCESSHGGEQCLSLTGMFHRRCRAHHMQQRVVFLSSYRFWSSWRRCVLGVMHTSRSKPTTHANPDHASRCKPTTHASPQPMQVHNPCKPTTRCKPTTPHHMSTCPLRPTSPSARSSHMPSSVHKPTSTHMSTCPSCLICPHMPASAHMPISTHMPIPSHIHMCACLSHRSLAVAFCILRSCSTPPGLLPSGPRSKNSMSRTDVSCDMDTCKCVSYKGHEYIVHISFLRDLLARRAK